MEETQFSSLTIRTGDDDRLSTPLRIASARSNPRIFLPKDDSPLAVTEKKEYILVEEKDGTFWTLYRDGASAERQCGTFPFRKWRAEYRDAGRTVLYRRFDGMGYALDIRIDQYRRVE